MCGATRPRLHIPTWRAHRQLYLYTSPIGFNHKQSFELVSKTEVAENAQCISFFLKNSVRKFQLPKGRNAYTCASYVPPIGHWFFNQKWDVLAKSGKTNTKFHENIITWGQITGPVLQLPVA